MRLANNRSKVANIACSCKIFSRFCISCVKAELKFKTDLTKPDLLKYENTFGNLAIIIVEYTILDP